MIPVLAIVGRPNVGKSTLFNYLTRSRDAIVADLPGVTRDRLYGEAQIGERKFIVIDTGGLGEETDAIDHLMAQQTRQAIAEADYVFFIVDARAGITPADETIALELRRLHKPIIILVNKAEGLDQNIVCADFYKLGLGEPHAISATNGMGINSFISNLPLPQIEEETIPDDETAGIKLAVVGRPNVGKSTLINRMLGEERVVVFDAPGTTRDSIFIPMERRGQAYTLIDTAGVRRRGKINETIEKFSVVKTLQAIEASHVVILVIDAQEGLVEQDLSLLGFVLESGKSLLIAINKWDGLPDDQRAAVRREIDRKLNFVEFAEIYFISALHGTGVGTLFAGVNRAYKSATKKMATPELTRILQKAIIQHQPPLVGGRRVKLRYAHPGGNNPPRIVIHGNQTESLPDAYRRYLSAVFRKSLKMVGTPVVIELRSGDNPYKGKKNVLTQRQAQKRRRLIQRRKK